MGFLSNQSSTIIEAFYAILYIGGSYSVEGLRKLYSACYRKISYHTATAALRRAATHNLIHSEKRAGARYYSLTEDGRQRIALVEDLLNKATPTNWKVVVFDIPEAISRHRHSLRSQLKRLGFMALQKSVWATNRSICAEDFAIVDELKLRPYVLMFETESIASWLTPEVMTQTFKLKELNQRYQALANQMVKVVNKWRTQSFSDANQRQQMLNVFRQLILTRYSDILKQDPQLPNKVLPKPWHRSRVVALLNQLEHLTNK